MLVIFRIRTSTLLMSSKKLITSPNSRNQQEKSGKDENMVSVFPSHDHSDCLTKKEP